MRARQSEMVFRTHGGRRKGAGRRREPGRRRTWIRERPVHDPRNPVHVTLRVVDAVGRLRRRSAYQAIRRALLTTLRRPDFRVVHLSIQHNHLHLICEADGTRELTRGIQGLQISAARRLNVAITEQGSPRRGVVFPDRYHAEVLTSPRQVRNCIAYVLNNWRRHREDLSAPSRLDPFASGVAFDGWNVGRFRPPDGYEPLPVTAPTAWLLSTGWRRHGLLDPLETPGPRLSLFASAGPARRGGRRRGSSRP